MNMENEEQIKKTKNRKPLIQLTSTIGVFEALVFMVAFSIVFCMLGYVIGERRNIKNVITYPTVDTEIQTFIDQYNNILENYYGDIDKNALIQKAIEGMLSSLDKYSGFLDNDSNTSSITLEGSYEGVGIEIATDSDGNIIILKVYEDTPAAKVGLKAGDIVIKFNDTDLKGKTSNDLLQFIQNKKEMTLTVKRNNDEIEVKVYKDKIILKSVSYEMLDNNIGYIRISVFANNTYEQFKKAMANFEKEGMDKLIIDVRSNGGGYLSSVEHILNLFVDSSHIIYQTQSKTETTKRYSKGKTNFEHPIVILQNGNSASASEILASSLNENLDAYIIGNTSYGKGTVQELQFANGIGNYKFTTSKWLTPNGNWINEKGITPDLEVSLNESYLLNPSRENDKQFQAALKYLKELDF